MHIKIDQNTSAIEEISRSTLARLYSLSHSNSLDPESLLRGRVNASATYQSYIDELHTKYPEFYITASKYYLNVGDPEFERICATNWGDGVGVIREDLEAATGYSAYSVFAGNTNIVDATSFKYFTNITAVPSNTSRNLRLFNGCTSLERCELPPHLTTSQPQTYSINNGWFANCSSLTYVKIPEGFIRMGQYMFAGCTSLEHIDLSDTQVQKIEANCFINSGLKTIIFPETLESIGFEVFVNTKLSTITIPKSVTYIGAAPFSGCNLLSEVIFEDGGTEGLTFNTGRGYGNNIISTTNATPLLTRIELPARTVDLGDHPFRQTSLTTIILRATTPPTVGSSGLVLPGSATLYVPDESLATYKATTGYSAYESQIKGISELPA